MNNKQTAKKNYTWRVFNPLLVYFGISLGVQFVITLIHSLLYILPDVVNNMMNVPELNADTNAVIMAEVMQRTTLFITMYSLHITVVSGIVTLIYSILTYRRDRRLDYGKTKEFVTEVLRDKYIAFTEYEFPYSKYVWLLLFGIVACYGLNAILVLVQVVFPQTAWQAVSEMLFTSPMWLQIIGIGFIAPISEEMLFRGLLFADTVKDTTFFLPRFIRLLFLG